MRPTDRLESRAGQSPSDRLEESRLVAQLRTSDVSALEQIYDLHSPAIFALCLRMMRDRQRAEELMQDTFWQLWSKPERYDASRGKLSTFLYQIARSRCLDRLRSEKSRAERIHSASGELRVDALLTQPNSPLAETLATEDRLRVRTAIETLAPNYRRVIILSYFDGLSQTEIAERVDAPLGTVKTHLRRGLLQLRQCLQSGGES